MTSYVLSLEMSKHDNSYTMINMNILEMDRYIDSYLHFGEV